MTLIVQSFVPLIAIVLAGVLVGRQGWGGAGFRKSLLDFCFYLGIPALLFRTMASAKSGAADHVAIALSYLLPAAVCWLAATAYVTVVDRRPLLSPAYAMAATYGNVLMLGIPLALSQFGEAAAPAVAVVALLHSPVLFTAAALHTEAVTPRIKTALLATDGVAVANPGRPKSIVSDVATDLATNPIIVAIVMGLAYRQTGMPLPAVADKALAITSQGTLPCVLVAIGLGLAAFRSKGHIFSITVMVALKLMAMPLIAWWLSRHVFHLGSAEVATVVLLSAMPIGANALIFAGRAGGAEENVSAAVAVSTMLSPLTMALVFASVQ